MAAAYMAGDCQLSSIRRSSSAAFCRLEDLCRQADVQQLWGPMFHGCRPKVMEQSSQLVLGKRASATNSDCLSGS